MSEERKTQLWRTVVVGALAALAVMQGVLFEGQDRGVVAACVDALRNVLLSR